MQLLGLSFLWLLAVLRLASAAFTKSAAGSSRSAASHGTASHWGPMDLGLGSAGDLPVFGQSDSESPDSVSIPGEGVVGGEDEMIALRQKKTPMALQQNARSQPLLSKSVKSLALANVQSKGLLVGASVDAGSTPIEESEKQHTSAAADAPQPRVLEEYDVQDDDGEDDDKYRTTKMKESDTREEVDRVQRGDVENVKPVEKKKKPLLKKLQLAATKQQNSKAAVKQEVVAIEEQAPGNDKMMGQCMAFAGWVKSQGSTGPDLVRIWKGTCMPAVMAGTAPPAYGNMCNALGTAVSKFAVAPWAPAELCQAVMQVFRESGVGATPLG